MTLSARRVRVMHVIEIDKIGGKSLARSLGIEHIGRRKTLMADMVKL